MKIIEKVLKNKLVELGIDDDKAFEQLSQIDFTIIDNRISSESDAENCITIRKYSEPTSEISRTLVNYNKFYIQNAIVVGNVKFSTSTTSIGTSFPSADYNLTENICIVATTISLNVEILFYNPSEQTKMQYSYQTYENLVASERNKIAKEYYDAFVENGRVSEIKVKSIMNLLLTEYIIDEMSITDENPKIKMYDNPDAYAENITEYRLKYINRRTNRIELAISKSNIKRLGANVIAGLVSNDPYIKLENLPTGVDFPMYAISCYWIVSPDGKKDEVAIYIASKNYGEAKTYKEYRENNNKKFDDIITTLQNQFQREIGKIVNRDYLNSVLNRLNPELIKPSMDVIRDCMENPTDPIEPLKYRFKATSDPTEFEDRLYISIEDNMGKRYKYKLTENVMDDLTRIGNKLEYTGEDGNVVRKQSIADFNINSNTTIIRRETLIDSSKIPDLLGYIYEDMEYLGTDMLPVPSIEVDFYFPKFEKTDVAMYNGTSFADSFENFSSYNKFYSDENNNINSAPGTTTATVRYVNSKGEVLKENIISNLYPGTPYMPEILPIISDVDGKEWICATTSFPSTVINMLPEYNAIEIKYKEKMSKVTISSLNRGGKQIRDDIVETIQVGTNYDIKKISQFVDEEGNEWKMVVARPQKLIVKEDISKNHLILIYDFEKETVTIRQLNINGELIKDPTVVEVQVGKYYVASLENILIDSNGLGWEYRGTNPIKHLVASEKENIIEVQYGTYKLPVTVSFLSEEGIRISNDSVEYIQVGKEFIPKFERKMTDIKLRQWQYKTGNPEHFVVSNNEKDNVIKMVYEPLLANVYIQIVNEDGNKILNPIQKQCQIGEEFSSVYMNEITDNFGRMWIKKENPASLLVSEFEVENSVTIKYKPLITNVTVKYFDDERNELIPSKTFERQAGTLFKPEIIENLESNDGRKWYLSNDKVQEITVKKNIEENIVSIFYQKEMTDVTIEFEDAYRQKLREPITVKGQIGSVFNPKVYDKIEDDNGYKWMMESSEPQKLIVKSINNKFKLIYGEVKALVVVKHMNVKTNKAIIDDTIAKVKLGGVYIPNIQERVYDNNKYLWKFIGDKNLSIVVKENEQENIVVLQYDEALAKVNVKYQDGFKNSLRNDISYDLQIGKEIDLKNMKEFIDDSGIGWMLSSTKSSSNKVVDGENEVINIYEPWNVDVEVRYITENEKMVAVSKKDRIQIGRTYDISYENIVRDNDNLLWQYKDGADDSVKIKEKDNIVNVFYVPVLANVIERFISKDGELITNDVINQVQVGSTYKAEKKDTFKDITGKWWKFVKEDKQKIVVLENSEQNIIKRIYEEKMGEITLRLFNEDSTEISEVKKYYAQIGSNYKVTLPQTVFEAKTKIGWILPEKFSDSIIVDEDSEKNIIEIHYQKYMVLVKERITDTQGNIIMPDKDIHLQVGTTFVPEISKDLKDEQGRMWHYGKQRERGLLLEEKNTEENVSIIVSENEEKNIAIIKYNPVLAKVTIKYQDNLGNIIAKTEEINAQIGSSYTPEIKEIIKDAKKTKWMFNPNSKSTIKVSADEKENEIILSYEEEKSPVVYVYVDELKNTLKEPKKQLEQIGSTHIPEIEQVIEDKDGRVWEHKSTSCDKLEVKEDEKENIVEFTYTPLLVDVEVNLVNKLGKLISKHTEKAQLGSVYVPPHDEIVCDDNSLAFQYVKCDPVELMIKEEAIGAIQKTNRFEITYEPVYSNVTIIYQDIDGNKLKEDDIEQLQVGTKYMPKFVQFVNDKKGIQWENISKSVEPIRVMQNEKENMIKMTFEVARAEVMIRYRDLDGNTIKEPSIYNEKIGTEFIPQYDEIIIDKQNRKWIFSSVDEVKITVGSINNIINLTYQEKRVPVIIKFETKDGRKLRADVKENVQEGIKYVPKRKFPVITEPNDIWRFIEFRPSSIIITDNVADNVIVQVYDNSSIEKEEKPKFVNPFANTLEENVEVEDNEKANIIEEIVNEEAETQLNSEEQKDDSGKEEVEENIQKSSSVNEKEEEISNSVEFSEKNLLSLSKTIVLTDGEILGINKLNKLNHQIIQELDNLKNNFDLSLENEVLNRINASMINEKKIIEEELARIISEDKTGKKLLKILEAIVSLDINYQKEQERKVVVLTDYFITGDASKGEQATYICERGKNTKKLSIVKEMINSSKNTEGLKDVYIDLIYEKAMLDNYYKSRTKPKDNFFISDEDRASVDSEVVILVSNILSKQAFNLLQKNNQSIIQQIELQAIINLLSPQERVTLEKQISTIKDGKQKKELLKRLKEFK